MNLPDKNRIRLEMTGMDAMVAMSGGNPGAVGAIVAVVKAADQVDPDCILGWIGPLGWLDSQGIYGSDLYVLWSYQCRRDVVKFIGMIRAAQLGIASWEKIKEASQDQMRSVQLPIDEWVAAVKERLPKFGATPLVEAPVQ